MTWRKVISLKTKKIIAKAPSYLDQAGEIVARGAIKGTESGWLIKKQQLQKYY